MTLYLSFDVLIMVTGLMQLHMKQIMLVSTYD